MFKTAVLGVIGSPRIRECIECTETGSKPCRGFGAGCFLPRAAESGRDGDAAAAGHARAEQADEPVVEDAARHR